MVLQLNEESVSQGDYIRDFNKRPIKGEDISEKILSKEGMKQIKWSDKPVCFSRQTKFSF